MGYDDMRLSVGGRNTKYIWKLFIARDLKPVTGIRNTLIWIFNYHNQLKTAKKNSVVFDYQWNKADLKSMYGF